MQVGVDNYSLVKKEGEDERGEYGTSLKRVSKNL